jgi:hypothetical protein
LAIALGEKSTDREKLNQSRTPSFLAALVNFTSARDSGRLGHPIEGGVCKERKLRNHANDVFFRNINGERDSRTGTTTKATPPMGVKPCNVLIWGSWTE